MCARLLRRSALLSIVLAGLASAQQIPFQLRVVSGSGAAAIPNAAVLGFTANIGQTATARVTATYIGTGKVNVGQQPSFFGSTAFTAALTAAPPLTLNPGDSLSFDIQFHPTSGNQANAQLGLPFTETVATGNNPPVTTASQISLSLQGTAPSFVLSYLLQTDQNVVPLQPGGAILFAPTLINTTAQANLNVSNLGSGAGQITNVSLISGTAFKLVGLPLFPVTALAGQTLQLVVRYLPTAVGNDTGQIQITLDAGNTITIGLQGSGISPAFTYNVLAGDQTTTVAPGGVITLPDTNLGDTASVLVRVQNTGNATAIVNAPGLAGQGFQLSDLPLFPQTLKPHDSFTFTINFAPSQPGNLKGQLVIGADLFSLAGRGLGSRLVFSYVSGGTTTTVGSGGSVVFSPVMISQSGQLDFLVKNTGTLPATISNIGIGESKSPFALSSLPPLPASLDPDGTLRFTITFSPTTTGFSNGTLRIDTATVALIASATAPPPLPAYTIQGPSGNVVPQSQLGVSLKLSAPYPVAIAGVLTLSISGTLASDPAVQFLTGGRTVAFVIPANGTDANFAGQGSQILLQAGTVASTITLTPSFATQAGGVDLTPNAPTTLQLTVPPVAPTLIAVTITNQTASSFLLNVTGFSDTRTLTSLTVTFTPASGVNVSGSQVAIDLRQVATVWFQSAASQTFGGQFTVSVPFNLTGTPPTGQTLLSTVASVSATISNERGASNSLQTNVQ